MRMRHLHAISAPATAMAIRRGAHSAPYRAPCARRRSAGVARASTAAAAAPARRRYWRARSCPIRRRPRGRMQCNAMHCTLQCNATQSAIQCNARQYATRRATSRGGRAGRHRRGNLATNRLRQTVSSPPVGTRDHPSSPVVTRRHPSSPVCARRCRRTAPRCPTSGTLGSATRRRARTCRYGRRHVRRVYGNRHVGRVYGNRARPCRYRWRHVRRRTTDAPHARGPRRARTARRDRARGRRRALIGRHASRGLHRHAHCARRRPLQCHTLCEVAGGSARRATPRRRRRRG